MATGIFTLRNQLQGLVQKAWYGTNQSTTSTYQGNFSGSNYLTVANNSVFDFASGNFTVECWFYKSGGSRADILSKGNATTYDPWLLTISTVGGVNSIAWYMSDNGSSYSFAIYSAISFSLNMWTHVAVVRNSSTITMYVNGSVAASASYSTSPYSGNTQALGIGSDSNGTYILSGAMSNVRVVKGTAVYTSAFTPPTAPLTAISGTSLLTLQNATIIDNSTNAFSITNTGSVSTTVSYPFNPVYNANIVTPAVEYLVVAGGGGGGDGYGSGAGAGGLLQGIANINAGTSLTVTVGSGGTGSTAGNNNATQGGSSVFGSISTVGGGVGPQNGSAFKSIMSGGSGGGASYASITPGQGTFGQGNAGGLFTIGAQYYSLGGGGAGTVGIANTSSNAGNGGAGITSAISGTVTAYAGGGGGGTYQTSAGTQGSGGVGGGGSAGTAGGNNAGVAGTANTGGGGGGASYYNGYAAGGNGGSGIVIISYPDTYNAPSALTGTYTASTSGSGSVYNNANSFIYTPSSSTYNLSSSNFTLEMWINVSNQNNLIRGITQYGAIALLLGGGQLTYYMSSNGTSWDVAGGINAGAVSLNTWTHIAFVRNGNVFTPYVNGVAGTTTTSSATLTSNNGFCIFSEQPLVYPTGNGLTTGYFSNFRVVIGTAVYTSNFTPSTSPLTSITNTKLLLNTVSGSYLADSSSLSATMLVGTNTPQWNQSSPFATGLGYKNRVYTWTGSGTVTF